MSLKDPLFYVTLSMIIYLYFNISVEMSIIFILPMLGTFEILDVCVTLVTALIGLLETGPFL